MTSEDINQTRQLANECLRASANPRTMQYGHLLTRAGAELRRLAGALDTANADAQRTGEILTAAGISDHEGGHGETCYARPLWHRVEEAVSWGALAKEWEESWDEACCERDEARALLDQARTAITEHRAAEETP